MSGLEELIADASFRDLSLQYVSGIVLEVGHLYLIGCAFFFLERVRPAQPDSSFFKKDFKTEACYPIFNTMISTPIFALIALLLTAFLLEPFVPFQVFNAQVLALPFWAQVLIGLLVADIAVYIEHRIAHRFLWTYHSLHHMTPEVNWLTHARVHPINVITIGLVAVVMRHIFGFDSEAVLTSGWIGIGIAIWEHSNMDVGFPKPFCYLLVSPRFHHWHHASEKAAYDKNFCLIFPFLDLLGGTYYCPDRMPERYGGDMGPGAEDEGGFGDIPSTFVGQLWYPFGKTLQRLVPRSPAGPPDDAT